MTIHFEVVTFRVFINLIMFIQNLKMVWLHLEGDSTIHPNMKNMKTALALTSNQNISGIAETAAHCSA